MLFIILIKRENVSQFNACPARTNNQPHINAMQLLRAYLLLYTLLFMSVARSETLALNVGSQTIQAEVAATQQSRGQGLMQRKQLCANCGMLFVFEHAARHGFWMKDTDMPLAIAFIAPDGSIIGIAEMQANTLSEHYPQGDILYALEMNKGWFASHGIRVSDKIDGLQLAPRGE